jgi:hypothetical protein
MAWIESHQAVGHHPKTILLAKLLKCRLPAAVGYLHFLWWWAIDYAPSGRIGRFSAPVLAHACELPGPPEVFMDALTGAGFVDASDSDPSIHDWDIYAGRLIARRQKDADRKRTSRGQEPDLQQTSNGRPADVHSLSGVPTGQTDRQTENNHTGPTGSKPDGGGARGGLKNLTTQQDRDELA